MTSMSECPNRDVRKYPCRTPISIPCPLQQPVYQGAGTRRHVPVEALVGDYLCTKG